ncbi:PREDICTED: probable WRKY transcription factor 69 [Tarenaya hassleriana]|uniref:probable WRKY transcription factor 69 n=1 Tax=Tarenaya hassleriana TaxID=28532 RepID=UPI00053C9C65|nr:PREDICTED: probable WRKY transcription factor 69 [Tarenaya hassleriana]
MDQNLKTLPSLLQSFSGQAKSTVEMHRRAQRSDEEDDDTYDGVTPDSPSSCEDSKIRKTSSKKRRNMKKRVVSVPVADVEGSKSRGEAYPPSDSWAWRKYGQKPIKGSPYPRGYYRCSSSKGCPARKQVERSRVDPTKIVITYASDHNHPLPSAATKPHHHRNHTVARKDADVDTAEADATPGLDLSHVDVPTLLGGCYCEPDEFGWFYDVAISGGADVAMEEVEEESLFSDLGDLPDCAAVFRRRTVAKEEQNRRCDFGLCDYS